jgi:hypothetical protein
MRRTIWWTLVLLGLPHVAAAADGTTGQAAAQAFAGYEAATARSESPSADLPPALDLRLVPRPLPPLQSPPAGSGAPGADRLDHYPRAEPADGPLSFGLELKRRRHVESRAWQDEDDAPGLQDDLQRLIEHSTLGVRGTYRF